MLSILGCDASLTHTACYHAGGASLEQITLRGFSLLSKPNDYPHAVARLAFLRERFRNHLQLLAPGTAYVEGYAFSRVTAGHSLAEWGGILRLLLHELGWSLVLVPPTLLKSFVCGKGNAPKELMLQQVLKRFGFEAMDNNQADGFALAQLGLAHAAWTDEPTAVPERVAEVVRKLVVWEPARVTPPTQKEVAACLS